MSLSDLQKNFQTHHTFKRNSRYYDTNMHLTQEKFGEVCRRKPVSQLSKSQKLHSCFTNSTAGLTNRLEKETKKFKGRVSLEVPRRRSEYEREYSSPSSPKMRTFYLEKMSSREYQHRLKNKAVEDERQFNNFRIEKPMLNQTCDFGKLKGKNLDITLKHMHDLHHESKKGHDSCFYRESPMKSKVNYSLENKARGRYFFNPRRPENSPATVMDPEKVDSGLKVASLYRGSNLRQDQTSPFFIHSGREMPCQADMRQMNELTNCYKDKDGKVMRAAVDYTIQKMREDLLAKKREEGRKKKRDQFTREEICDQRYFKMKTRK